MKAELSLSPELVNEIADKVIEKLLPLLDNGKGTDEDEIFNINHASAFLQTSKGQIYQWVSNSKHGLGNFPYQKAGKQLRFSKKELIEWMNTNKNR